MADTDIKKGLAGVVVDYTAVSKVNPDSNSLLYRGYPVQELAATQPVEAVDRRAALRRAACHSAQDGAREPRTAARREGRDRSHPARCSSDG